VKIAASFLASSHAFCVVHFEDVAFDGVAGALTLLMQQHAITPATCTKVLEVGNSPAVSALSDATGGNLNVVSSFLDCGCAVAQSGIGERLAEVVGDVAS
jgi:hypothetical protein